jgi:hypothetical protein
MIHTRIAAASPFGDNEQANLRVRESLSLVTKYAQEANKLASLKTRDLNARSAQRGYVEELRGELAGRAQGADVETDAFITACLEAASKRAGRRIALPAPKSTAPDAKDRELEAAVFEAEDLESQLSARASADFKRYEGSRDRFDAASKSADIARARLAARRAAAKAAA